MDLDENEDTIPMKNAEKEAERLRYNLTDVVKRLDTAIDEKNVDINMSLDDLLD